MMAEPDRIPRRGVRVVESLLTRVTTDERSGVCDLFAAIAGVNNVVSVAKRNSGDLKWAGDANFDWVSLPPEVKRAVDSLATEDGDFLFTVLAVWADLPADLRSEIKGKVQARTELCGAMTFGRKLEWLRKDRGLTQRELADEADVPIDTVRKIEQGRTGRVTLTVAVRLAKVFGRSVSTWEHCDGIDLRKPKAVQRPKRRAEIK